MPWKKLRGCVDSRCIVWYKYIGCIPRFQEISAAYIRVDEAGSSTISIQFLRIKRRHIPGSNFVVVAMRTLCLRSLLIRLECIYLSNTSLFDGSCISSIYCVRYSYMFRRLTMAIFRLYMKCLVSSYTYLLTYLLTYSMVQVLLEKLSSLQLVKKFPAFHGTRRFITALTTVRHLSLSWTSPIQSIHQHPTSWRSILILSTHLRLGLHSGLFPSGFPTKTLYTPLSSPIRATCPAHLILLE